MFFHIIFFTLSLILTLLFFLYGFNHYYLLNATRKYLTPTLPDETYNRPNVSIHLPVYNEKYVIQRLLDACASMAVEYGTDKVTIKILDDSTDDTTLEVDRIVDDYKSKVHMEILRRTDRCGFKAGALQAALDATNEEFIVIFDADFIPPRDFLLQTIPYFAKNDRLGIIQSRWTHLNRNYSLLTKAIALGIDVHFLIEQTGRFAMGCLQNFNGSGGVLRKKAIIDAGGWQSDTLSEDLDLSYRMQNIGYKILFLKDLLSPGEVPPTIPSFKKQQGRWACGSLRTARKLLPTLMKNKFLGWNQRLQAFIHLTGYILHPMMLAAFLLICTVTLTGLNNPAIPDAIPFGNILDTEIAVKFATLQQLAWGLLFWLIAFCTLAPWISMIVALKSQKLSVSLNISSLITVFLLGYGISMSNSIEAVKALLTNRDWEFTRTPKYADLHQGGDWKTRIYQVPLDFVWLLEFALICLGIVTMTYAVRSSNFGALLILIPYTTAYIFVFSLTLIQSRKEKSA
jgi:cellulose synthase/poly-beta-1,6-N-acetylglucosamine synthase-like glycosyltransferase